MTNAEDIKFLFYMKTDRSASFVSFDAVLDCKMKHKYSRVGSEERRGEEVRKEIEDTYATVPTEDLGEISEDTTDDENGEEKSNDPGKPNRKH